MKKKKVSFLAMILTFAMVACGQPMTENALDTGDEEVLSGVNNTCEETESECAKHDNVAGEVKETTEVETQTEVESAEKEEGFTVAVNPIVVPDPSTQSEFVIEVTAENFLSIFEFVAINQYNDWGEYTLKLCGFSSLLYDQGWAIGNIKDFAIEYDVFDYSKLTLAGIFSAKFGLVADENSEAEVRMYRAKGTITFYPIESVQDTLYEIDGSRFFLRTLPDGSEVWIHTDVDGIMVY